MIDRLYALQTKEPNSLNDNEKSEMQDLLAQQALDNPQPEVSEVPVDPQPESQPEVTIVEPQDAAVEAADFVPEPETPVETPQPEAIEVPETPEETPVTTDPDVALMDIPDTTPEAPEMTDNGDPVTLEQVVQSRHSVIDQTVADLEAVRSGGIPVNREFSLAITKLEEALMWLAKSAKNLGIAIVEKVEQNI